jgi:thiol-disulfide isomerase/thioredoxin
MARVVPRAGVRSHAAAFAAVKLEVQIMNRMFRTANVVCTAALLCVPALADQPNTGAKFPNFKATDLLTNKPIDLDDFRGKIVIVDFWATWCGPCIAELPNVRENYKKYHDKGLEIISISLDSDIAKCKSYAMENDMPWFHVSEGDAWKTRLAQQYGINSIPAMFILDANGVVVGKGGNVRGENLAKAIEKAMDKTPPSLGPIGADRAGEALEAADKLRDAKQWVKADEAYAEIIEEFAGSESAAKAQDARGALRQNEDAAKAIEKAEAQQREEDMAKQTESWMAMARSLAKNKRYDGARKYYQRVIDTYPDTEAAVEAKAEMARLPK